MVPAPNSFTVHFSSFFFYILLWINDDQWIILAICAIFHIFSFIFFRNSCFLPSFLWLTPFTHSIFLKGHWFNFFFTFHSAIIIIIIHFIIIIFGFIPNVFVCHSVNRCCCIMTAFALRIQLVYFGVFGSCICSMFMQTTNDNIVTI